MQSVLCSQYKQAHIISIKIIIIIIVQTIINIKNYLKQLFLSLLVKLVHIVDSMDETALRKYSVWKCQLKWKWYSNQLNNYLDFKFISFTAPST